MIHVRGKSTKLSSVEAAYAARFYLNKLISPKKLNSLSICIILQPFKNKNTIGFVERIGKDLYNVEINNRYGKEYQLKSLAHELVHVKQYVYKELGDVSLSQFKWKGKTIDYNSLSYFEYPHEIEAFGLEHSLYSMYTIQKRLDKIKFK